MKRFFIAAALALTVFGGASAAALSPGDGNRNSRAAALSPGDGNRSGRAAALSPGDGNRNGRAAASVAVVARSPGYDTSLAKHIVRWLAGQDVAASLATPADMGAAFAKAKIAFLVGFNDPSEKELAEIAAFRGRGGKLVVFHSASPRLAAIMGVKPLGYKTAAYPGQWSRMDFVPKAIPGVPPRILQTSTVLQRAVPAEGKGARVVATWSDRQGRPTGDAAWIASPAGFWMTHVLLADGDEHYKALLVAAIAASAAPGLWNPEAASAKAAAEHKRLREFAKAQIPRKGEIHAVWDHSGCGLYPGDWPRTMKVLREARVSDLFVNVAGAGFAHYPSTVLPRSKTFLQEGDQLAACLAAAKGTGIRVHAWILCFNATRGSPDTLALYAKRGWRLKAKDGRLTEYLDPSNAAVAKLILDAIDEIQTRYGVSGIHLDFVRWYEGAAKPADAATRISRFVASARARIRRPLWLTTAVLGKYPACIASVGQDWTGWLDSGIVDYVVPMDYTESEAQFESFVAQHAATKTRARKTIAGIGVTANESRLDARQVIKQILIARKYNLAGVSLFDLDTLLEKRILPYLVLGLW